MASTREAEFLAVMRLRAFRANCHHEAGHAVAMWRAECEKWGRFGYDFDDQPGFSEIVVASLDKHLNAKPFVLSDGRKRNVGGTVVPDNVTYIPGAAPQLRAQQKKGRSGGGGFGRRWLQATLREQRIAAGLVVRSLLAGPIAEARLRDYEFDWWDELGDAELEAEGEGIDLSGHDLSKAVRIANDFCRGQKQVNSYMDAAQDQTAEFLNDPRVWGAVTALAHALERRRRLTGDQALRVMRRGWKFQGGE